MDRTEDTITIQEPYRPGCYVTDHNNAGKAVISEEDSRVLQPKLVMGCAVHDVYDVPTPSVQLHSSDDGNDKEGQQGKPKQQQQEVSSDDGRIFPAGMTTARLVDYLPGHQPVLMHRTLTLDFGVVIHGELELTLDSGETRLLRAGDTVVQRATMHSWRNPHPTQPCRAFFVVLPVDPPPPYGASGELLKEEVVLPPGMDMADVVRSARRGQEEQKS
ncbi:hypothetical protein BX600DRAFT_553679 [Xylariales sp. PMI_506]|nr:hypothetical protein BX600DRAFT_553679 [Xylariales sp. PMI_506]